MEKTVTVDEAVKLSAQLKAQNKSIVLAGGCFDILHAGHISFLKKAKRQGDNLFVLLESDDSIRHSKGKNRPINTQQDRSEVLASLEMVDHIVQLKGELTDKEYDELILALKPAIIATTAPDPYRMHKERQAALVGAKVVDVINTVKTNSTTRIADLLRKEL